MRLLRLGLPNEKFPWVKLPNVELPRVKLFRACVFKTTITNWYKKPIKLSKLPLKDNKHSYRIFWKSSLNSELNFTPQESLFYTDNINASATNSTFGFQLTMKVALVTFQRGNTWSHPTSKDGKWGCMKKHQSFKHLKFNKNNLLPHLLTQRIYEILEGFKNRLFFG